VAALAASLTSLSTPRELLRSGSILTPRCPETRWYPAKKGTVKVEAKVLTKSQSALSGGAKVRLKLKTGRKGPKKAKVRIRIEAKQSWSNWTGAGSRSVRLRAGKAKRIRVKLNSKARSIALNCGSPKLRLSTKVRSRGKTKGARPSGSSRARTPAAASPPTST